MHITSLPGKYGIGTLGNQAYKFVDFLRKSGQTYWQILPIGPTGYGDSPYQSFSTYAGNPYLIDLEILCDKNLIDRSYLDSINWGDDYFNIDFEKIYLNKLNVLRKVYNKFKEGNTDEFCEFIDKNKFWLKDYALFMAVKQHFNMVSWQQWPDESIKNRKEDSIIEYSNKLADEINFFMFVQFLFYSQWNRLKSYANSLGIKIIGDVPIYVGLDSSDVWANPQIFCLDEQKRPTIIAGCPPDDFSPKGQLWGNPIYNWDYLRETDFDWWIKRIKWCLSIHDVVRIDHFRGFDSYYAIDYNSEDATKGQWLDGPGIKFFTCLKEKLDNLEIIAEDLGFLTQSVKSLLLLTGFPGMKILQFAFNPNQEENYYLPHNYSANSVVYTGTHDNDTIRGWFESCDENTIKHAIKYGALTNEEGLNWGMIRMAYSSISDLAIIPIQDFLNLGTDCRMNTPSTINGNWRFRLSEDMLTDKLASKINELTKLYGRM